MRAAVYVTLATAVALAICSIDGSAHPSVNGVTWNGTIASVLDRHCVSCHGNGGAAPRLDDYREAHGAAQAIKQAVLLRRMPMWNAAAGSADFANDRTLTPYETGLIADWADDGAPFGDPARSRPRAEASHGAAPDVRLRVASKYAIHEAVHTFDLPTGFDSPQWIRGWSFEPGNRALVRAAVISRSSGAVIGTWVPGDEDVVLPDGAGVRLDAGETIRLTIHYAKPQHPAADASALGLFLARQPLQAVEHLAVGCGSTRIAEQVRLLAIRPAITTAGASLRVMAQQPNQQGESLGWFRGYSTDVPQTYWYRTPVLLERGATIAVSAMHGDCAVELDYVSGAAALLHPVASHPVLPAAGGDGEDGLPFDYTCPMHPDVRSEQPGACPVCQMAMIQRGPRIEGAYVMDAQLTRAGHDRDRTLRLTVTDPAEGLMVREFEKVHERPFHLFVVSEDLREFSHVHPQADGRGHLVLPSPPVARGAYRVFADFLPKGGTPQLLQKTVIAGEAADVRASATASLAPDLADKVDHDLRAKIEIEGGSLVAGRPGLIDLLLTDAATGEPLHDLEPYLGAWGHMFIVSADLSDAVHSHPITPLTERGASRIVFYQRFPKPGMYRLWTQFQRASHVATVSFTVAVQ